MTLLEEPLEVARAGKAVRAIAMRRLEEQYQRAQGHHQDDLPVEVLHAAVAQNHRQHPSSGAQALEDADALASDLKA
eukprot:CAMPEP_0115494708 /NCGR_PEP_ID=MMETSP0271-20121206/64864_1 /TAXON_ID=71861 /ORGANISM="Scrippsiella trochoidea, Strain CCMP3099" /LENGTH=76 /DNA_ID=CAMNT_0002923305 /DNA_START=191 /DNA_END=419 /DNA_ORIENTATION=+